MSEPKINIRQNVMDKIKSGKVKMKPKWYFVLGSVAMVSGLVGISVVSIFLVSLITLFIRMHGRKGFMRFEQLISDFPWWAPIVAIIGIVLGIIMLKKYDFSYKKNFHLIIIGFILSIIITGLLIDFFGLDNIMLKRGPFHHLFQQSNRKPMR